MTAAYNSYDVHKSRPQNGSRAGQGKSQKKCEDGISLMPPLSVRMVGVNTIWVTPT